MAFFVVRLRRPYDYHVLIEAYIYTQRTDFVHVDFTNYYAALLSALEQQFGLRLHYDTLTTMRQRVFWMHFQSTIRSLLQITHPWADYLEDTLLTEKLRELPEVDRTVADAGQTISTANASSKAAHRDILYALFPAIFGDHPRIVSSTDLLAAGFDDSREPDSINYYDNM